MRERGANVSSFQAQLLGSIIMNVHYERNGMNVTEWSEESQRRHTKFVNAVYGFTQGNRSLLMRE